MKNLYLDITTKDLVLENFNLRLTKTAGEHLSQKIENRLKLVYGEFFANELLGLPYFTRILGKSVDIDDITVLFKQEILSIPEVVDILSFTLDFNSSTRELLINFKVTDGNSTTEGGFTV